MPFKSITLGCIALIAMLSSTPLAVADDTADMQAQINSLQTRVDTMDEIKMDRMQKEEMAQMMKDILQDAKMQPAMPKWMKNLTFFGDLRLTYRMDHSTGRPVGLMAGGNEGKQMHVGQFRLRFGFIKTWWDNQMEVGFRINSDSNMTGALSVGSDVTMGGGFNKKRIGIDLAYAKYQPKWADGLTLLGGKMENPIHTATPVSWDGDFNPEGFLFDYVAPFFGDFRPYTQFGYWLVNLDSAGVSGTTRDTTIWSFSLGFDWDLNSDMALFFGATYYQWQNYRDSLGTGVNLGGLGFNPQTNMGLLELTTIFSWNMLNLPWDVWGTWTHNCKDNYSGNRLVMGTFDPHFKNKDNALAMGLSIGANEKKGDWSAYTATWYIQGNSTPGFLTTGDLGSNSKGWMIGARYNFDDFLTLGGELYSRDPINGGTWGSNPNNVGGPGYNADGSVTFIIDATWEF